MRDSRSTSSETVDHLCAGNLCVERHFVESDFAVVVGYKFGFVVVELTADERVGDDSAAVVEHADVHHAFGGFLFHLDFRHIETFLSGEVDNGAVEILVGASNCYFGVYWQIVNRKKLGIQVSL